jgi:hypothetical protein
MHHPDQLVIIFEESSNCGRIAGSEIVHRKEDETA